MLSKDSLTYESFLTLSRVASHPFDSTLVPLFDSLYGEMDAAFAGLPVDTTTDCEDALALVRMHQVRLLGKTGIISILFQQMKNLADSDRVVLHGIRRRFMDYCDSSMAHFSTLLLMARLRSESLDMTLMPREHPIGRLHPLTQTMDDVVRLFSPMGFVLAQGDDIEDDWHNFTALNIPVLHPARQNHDTFYLKARDSQGQRFVLRTHTSPVQIRTMTALATSLKMGQPFMPIRIIVPGRTYRADHDATHSPMFHQLEGLVIDRSSHFGHLKHTLMIFLQQFFGIADLPVRFRPSHFPFTEPSVEVDIGCSRAAGQLRIGGGDDWLEILGAGMVHPSVLANCGLDPALYQGFAFGMGLERLTMLKYGIPDLRSFFAGDCRWLSHYGFLGV